MLLLVAAFIAFGELVSTFTQNQVVAAALDRTLEANLSRVGLGSSRLTCEDAYLMQRFIRTVAGSPHVTVGPTGGNININTASRVVLQTLDLQLDLVRQHQRLQDILNSSKFSDLETIKIIARLIKPKIIVPSDS